MLSHFERSLLEFEAAHLRHTAHKQAGIREHGFAPTPTAYYTMLRAVLANATRSRSSRSAPPGTSAPRTLG